MSSTVSTNTQVTTQPSGAMVINPGTGNQKPFVVVPQTKTAQALRAGQSGSAPAPAAQALDVDNTPGVIMPQVVVGSDNRKIITNTTVYPWRAVCRIVSTFPDGTQTVGTGTLIGDRYVLTVAHVIYKKEFGGIVTSLDVTPGQNQLATPFGTFKGVKYLTFNNYLNFRDPNYDMALLKLDAPIGLQVGWFGFAYYPQVTAYKTANNAGYPIDKDNQGRQLWRAFGPLTSEDAFLLYHRIDTYSGQSGGPLYLYFKKSNERYVVAVDKDGSIAAQLNRGVKIDAYKFDVLVSAVTNGF